MDKETLSNYGWIVICVLVLAVMIALATPFGNFVATAVKNTTQGLFDTNQKALNSTGLINISNQSFENKDKQFDHQAPELHPNNIIPTGATYVMGDGTTLIEGNEFPQTTNVNDKYLCGDYTYKYISGDGWEVSINEAVKTRNESKYGNILESINNKPIISTKNLFLECSQLKQSPAIPLTVTNMDGTFSDCTALETAPSIPQGVTTMQGTFEQCRMLKKAPAIPEGVTNMWATFNYCTSLTDVPGLPSTVTNLQDTFAYCTSLKNAPAIPSSTMMMIRTFKGCSSLIETPEFGEGVGYLMWTFQDCTSLKKIVLPTNIINLQETFRGCTALTELPTFPETMFSMAGTFADCISLTDLSGVILPNNCDIYKTFSNCTSLTNAPAIPNGTKSLDGAFENCTSLSGTIIINTDASYSGCFKNVDFERQNITLTGNSSKLDEIGATGTNYCPTCNGKCQNNH